VFLDLSPVHAFCVACIFRRKEIMKQLLTVKELAERWRVSNMHLYRLVKQGDLKAMKIGKILRFHIDDVLEAEQRFTTGVDQ
jgi:excisionase family DNA binding protein